MITQFIKFVHVALQMLSNLFNANEITVKTVVMSRIQIGQTLPLPVGNDAKIYRVNKQVFSEGSCSNIMSSAFKPKTIC
jgi:hypothetical protein